MSTLLDVGGKIRECREALGMTQDELAEKAGYKSRSSINKIERGGNNLPQSKIVLFAKILQTTPAYLMGWEDEEKNPPIELNEREILKKMIDSADYELLVQLRNYLKYLLWLEDHQEDGQG